MIPDMDPVETTESVEEAPVTAAASESAAAATATESAATATESAAAATEKDDVKLNVSVKLSKCIESYIFVNIKISMKHYFNSGIKKK